MLKFLKSRARDEDGAITVDWVVLTAAIVGLAGAGAASILASVNLLSTDVSTQVTNKTVN